MIRRFRVRRCEVPFIIWFRERTGSSHLCSLLNSHPEIACRHEDFHEFTSEHVDELPKDVELVKICDTIECYRRMKEFDSTFVDSPTTKQVVTHLHNVFAFPRKANGFKLKYPIQNQLFPEVMKELSLMGSDLRVIALSRRNVLKQAISRQNMLRISQGTNGTQFHLNTSDSDKIRKRFQERVEIDVKQVVSYARQLDREKTGFEEVLAEFGARSKNKILQVDYEELLADQSAFLRNVFEYLEVAPYADVVSNFDKATPNQLRNAIENYDELKNAIHGTELERFLED